MCKSNEFRKDLQVQEGNCKAPDRIWHFAHIAATITDGKVAIKVAQTAVHLHMSAMLLDEEACKRRDAKYLMFALAAAFVLTTSKMNISERAMQKECGIKWEEELNDYCNKVNPRAVNKGVEAAKPL